MIVNSPNDAYMKKHTLVQEGSNQKHTCPYNGPKILGVRINVSLRCVYKWLSWIVSITKRLILIFSILFSACSFKICTSYWSNTYCWKIHSWYIHQSNSKSIPWTKIVSYNWSSIWSSSYHWSFICQSSCYCFMQHWFAIKIHRHCCPL